MEVLLQTTMNAFLEMGKEHWTTVRKALKAALIAYNPHSEVPGTRLRLVPVVRHWVVPGSKHS